MKRTGILKPLIISIAVALFFTACSNTSRNHHVTSDKAATQWYKKYQWLNGLNLIPHESINKTEFSRQYHKNPVWWDKAFQFLRTQNLENLKPGTYIIDSNNVIATVSEVSPKQKDSTNWEAHRNFNDLQYIINGKASMGIASISGLAAKVIIPYTPADNETFSVDDGKYYVAEPGTFFIFTPKEIHRPAFRVPGFDKIKKIVIKVRVP